MIGVIPWRAWAAAGVVLGFMAFVAVTYERGRDAVKSEIKQQNSEAENAANYGELGLVECDRAGGVWDFWAGQCAGPSGGDR